MVTALMLYLLIHRYTYEQKQAEDEIENYRRRLESIISSSNDIIFLKDKDFRYLIANKAHEKLFNVKVTDIIGKTDFDFMPKDVAEECRRSDEETLKYGSIKRKEYSGSRYFHVIKHRVVDTSGNVGIVGVIRDITDYRHAMMKITCQQTKSEQTIDDITTR
ncbi:PAS domain-containing protein [Dissulfurispira sp.]|uniref:PAS domain-containing protein n=1 Tax=Dissulfurispira sp. TaxID=2817609 RepID=UPI002FDA4037